MSYLIKVDLTYQSYSKNNKKVSFCKQIARQHRWCRVSTLQKFSLDLVWSPCKIWLFLSLCAHMWGRPKNLGDAGAPPPWDGRVADAWKRNTRHVLAHQISSL